MNTQNEKAIEVEMEQTKQVRIDNPLTKTATIDSSRANIWVPADQAYQRVNQGFQTNESQPSRGKAHACKVSQRSLLHATDRLKRANRDLGETAAFILAALTTATAIEAVINIAVTKIELSNEFMQNAFKLYIGIFVLIFLWGTFRCAGAIRRRAQAEREIDQAKKGVFEFCPGEQWPKPEEP